MDDEIKKLLEQTSKEALIDFVCHQAEMDEALSSRIKMHFKTSYYAKGTYNIALLEYCATLGEIYDIVVRRLVTISG